MSGGGGVVKAMATLAAGDVMEATTEGALLGGRLAYRQFGTGYRTGIEPVLLAASIAARPGEAVLEAGCGAGSALLCLCHRIPGLQAHGIEADPETLLLARRNMELNGMHVRLHQAVLPTLPAEGMPAGPDPGQPRQASFDHIYANPPWHRADGHRHRRLPRRDLARRAGGGLLEEWAALLSPMLRPGGTLSLILPAALHARACAALQETGAIGGVDPSAVLAQGRACGEDRAAARTPGIARRLVGPTRPGPASRRRQLYRAGATNPPGWAGAGAL